MTEEADPTAGSLATAAQALSSKVRSDEGEVRINLKIVLFDHDDLWSFIMLPDAPPVSRLPFPFGPLRCTSVVLTDAIGRG
jgi:hypothetical protein